MDEQQLAQIRADHFKVTDTFGIGWRIPADPEVDTFEEDDEPYDRMVLTADSGDPFKPGGRYVVVFETAQQEWLADWLRRAPERENELLAEIERLRAQLAAVEKFCAARAEYITAINNCPPENSHDYWRWQGHAEGRRQLSQELDLPVAWPTEYKRTEQVTP